MKRKERLKLAALYIMDETASDYRDCYAWIKDQLTGREWKIGLYRNLETKDRLYWTEWEFATGLNDDWKEIQCAPYFVRQFHKGHVEDKQHAMLFKNRIQYG